MTIDPVSAVLEGVLLGIDDFEGVDPRNATTEDIIKACTRLVMAYGIKLEGQWGACGETSFQLGGDDKFSYSEEIDNEGNPAILIQIILKKEGESFDAVG